MRLLLMQCPVAGFQFHFGERCWTQMREGDGLTLRREPGNRHDVRAVRIEWNGEMLGYLPRDANYAVSQMMDRGARVEAKIAVLRLDKDPWNRVMVEVAAVVDVPLSTGRDPVPYDVREPPAKRPEPIVLSLANRIFGAPASPQQVNWTFEHAGALALIGIEHQALLPFFRIFLLHDTLMLGIDAYSALRNHLDAAGLEAGSWKRLEKWGFEPFRQFSYSELRPGAEHIATYANLLLRLDVQSSPSPIFSRLAWYCVVHEGHFETAMLDTFPDWFMRALLRECESAQNQPRVNDLEEELVIALEWAVATDPKPDANQQHAGWPWIMERARRAQIAKLLAREWPVPIGDMTFGSHVVVPIRSAEELWEEGHAMSNCLVDYEEECARGDLIVFSIRRRATGKRVACFAVSREADRWFLVQAVGKANAPVKAEIEAIAGAVLSKVSAHHG